MRTVIAGLIIVSSLVGTTLVASANYFGYDALTKQGQRMDGPVFGPIEKGGI